MILAVGGGRRRGRRAKEYAAERRRCIDPARAAVEVTPGDPWRTCVALDDPSGFAGGGGFCTAHLCAVDANRNVVTLTQTLVDYFGCGVMVPGTGILLNNAMLWFDPRPNRPNSVGPGKRGVINMAPLLVLRGDRPLLAVGAPGGHRIINALAQVITNVLDAGMGIQDAITTPRIDCSGPNVVVDSRIPEHVVAGLERIGHRIEVVEESVHANHFSRPVGILIDPDGDQLHGGVDPFRVAVAAGY